MLTLMRINHFGKGLFHFCRDSTLKFFTNKLLPIGPSTKRSPIGWNVVCVAFTTCGAIYCKGKFSTRFLQFFWLAYQPVRACAFDMTFSKPYQIVFIGKGVRTIASLGRRICGQMFGVLHQRHRPFKSNLYILGTTICLSHDVGLLRDLGRKNIPLMKLTYLVCDFPKQKTTTFNNPAPKFCLVQFRVN